MYIYTHIYSYTHVPDISFAWAGPGGPGPPPLWDLGPGPAHAKDMSST